MTRTLRWRLWLCSDRPGLLGLAAGTVWLGVGSGAFGTALLLERNPSALLHLITVGALATLTIGVMLRIHYHATRRQPPPATVLLATLLPITLVTLARLTAGPSPLDASTLLWTATGAWSLAYTATASALLFHR